jgi:orotidine-5'-phosphate decarboxylase
MNDTNMRQNNLGPVIFCAVDTADLDTAKTIAGKISGAGCGIKLGLEFFNGCGPDGVRAIREAYPDIPVFLDLKYHDIPNTVAGAVRAATALGVSYINLHAAGGLSMMQAAKEAATEEATKRGIAPPRILAVTILTSLDEAALDQVGYKSNVTDRVVQMASLSQKAGMDGVVCSAHEIENIRAACGSDFVLMVPGIRPKGSATGDQKRIMTPAEAINKGATHLVIGRPITQADDPAQTARDIIADLAA